MSDQPYEYNPSEPPPPLITISRAEYDRIKVDVELVLTLHTMLRKVSPLVFGLSMTDEELNDLRMAFQHWYAQYPVTM